jgi:hypothetical protein
MTSRSLCGWLQGEHARLKASRSNRLKASRTNRRRRLSVSHREAIHANRTACIGVAGGP